MNIIFKSILLFFFIFEYVIAGEVSNQIYENKVIGSQFVFEVHPIENKVNDGVTGADKANDSQLVPGVYPNEGDEGTKPDSNSFPPPLVIVSSLALLLSFYNLWDSKSERKRIISKSINDDFWFRTIVIPTVLEPLVAFANDFSTKLISNNFSNNADYLENLQNELAIIQERFILLKIFNNDLYDSLNKYSDEFEDQMAEYCFKKSKENQCVDSKHASGIIFDYLRKTIETIKSYHNDI